MNQLSIGSARKSMEMRTDARSSATGLTNPYWLKFLRSLRVLVQSLGDEAEDEYWRQTLGPIRKLAFAFCSVPVPFAQAAATTGIDWAKVQRQIRLCQQLFPDSHEILANLVQKLERLSLDSGSPLIGPLEELLRQSGSLRVMIRNPRMNQAAAAYFAGNPRLRHAGIVSATQLRGAHTCDVLATIGPCGWFPEYVFSAPRAPAIHVISFRWIRDGWKPGPILLHNQDTTEGKNRNHRIGTMPRVGGDSATDNHAPSDIQPAGLLPPMPVFARGAFVTAGSQSDITEETVPAQLCHLSGNRAVLVAADDGATSLIIDTSETGLHLLGERHG